MIKIGTRVRIVGRATAAAGRQGTVILVTAAGDGFLVEADEEFTIGVGTIRKIEAAAPRRRWWCAADELKVIGGPDWLWRGMAHVRHTDPPSDLAAARLATRASAATTGVDANQCNAAKVSPPAPET